VDKLTLRPVEVAETLGLSRSRVYELIHSGEMPAIRVGTSILVSVEALRQWIADQEPVAPVAAGGYTWRDRI